MKICIFKLKGAHRVFSIINEKKKNKNRKYSSVKKKKKMLFLPFKK